MKNNILLIIILIFILLTGCSTKPDTSLEPMQSGSEIENSGFCGDGIVDDGETSDNCCPDVGCSIGNCLEDEQGYSCQVIEKVDSEEFQRIIVSKDFIFDELNKTFPNWTAVEQETININRLFGELSSKGYMDLVDEEFLQLIEDELYIQKYEYEYADTIGEKKEELLNIYEAEISYISTIDLEIKEQIKEEYNYDLGSINENYKRKANLLISEIYQ